MTQNNNSWRKTYFTLLAGQAISFISSGILQMAIIFYLVAKTNSAIILTAATTDWIFAASLFRPVCRRFCLLAQP